MYIKTIDFVSIVPLIYFYIQLFKEYVDAVDT